MLMELVRERLSKPDCKINGWILDGCPVNAEQITKLTDIGFIPSLVFALDQSDSLVYENIEQHRFDPIDGKYYNLLKDSATLPEDVVNRLVQTPENSHAHVKKLLQDYRNFLSTVENEYRKQLVRINVEDAEEKEILEKLCDAVEKNTI